MREEKLPFSLADLRSFYQRTSPLEKSLLSTLALLNEEREAPSAFLFFGSSDFQRLFIPAVLTWGFRGEPLGVDFDALPVDDEAKQILIKEKLLRPLKQAEPKKAIFLEKATDLPASSLEGQGTIYAGEALANRAEGYRLALFNSPSFSEARAILEATFALELGFRALALPFDEKPCNFESLCATIPYFLPEHIPEVYFDPALIQRWKRQMFLTMHGSVSSDPLWRFFSGEDVKREEAYRALYRRYNDHTDPLTSIAEYEHRSWELRSLLRLGYRKNKANFYRPFSALVNDYYAQGRDASDSIRYDYYSFLILGLEEDLPHGK